jgi:hypothetical protein
MAAALSTSSLYPVVREIDEEAEYGTCCCIDGAVMGRFSLQALPPVLPTPSMHQRSQSDQTNNSSKSAKRSSLFQAKRRRSAVQRARSEGALIDASDTQTISTEAEEKKFEESYVLTRQVSDACGPYNKELNRRAGFTNTFIRSPSILRFRKTRSFAASRPYYGNAFIASPANVIVSRFLIGVASDQYRSKRLWNERLPCCKTPKATWVLSKYWT